MRHSVLRWIHLIVGVGVTALCLWLSLRQLRWDELSSLIRDIVRAWLTGALGALTAGYVVRVHRWWHMLRLRNDSLPYRACVWPVIVGYAVNNIVPFRVGDAFRVVGFRAQLCTVAIALTGSLLLERILDVTILLLFLLASVALWLALAARSLFAKAIEEKERT